jgi:hypothetical protein
VVAVKRVLARVRLAAYPRAADKPLDLRRYLLARGMKCRYRRARPDHHPHVDVLRELREQCAEDDRALTANELEVRCEVPAGDVDVRAGRLHGLGDRGERLRAVDQDVELVARTRRRRSGRPESPAVELNRAGLPQPLQTPPVMMLDRLLDRVPEQAVDPSDRFDHVRSVPVAESGEPGATR